MSKQEIEITGVTERTVTASVNDEFETVLGTDELQNLPQEDFRWTKDRNNDTNHIISDSIRGDKYLSSDLMDAEVATVPAVDADDINWCASLPNHTPSNTDGSITSEVKANSFMSAVSYVGTGDNATVGHGLSIAPELLMVKNRTNATDWSTYNKTVTALNHIFLNLNVAQSESAYWDDTEPTSDVFSIGTSGTINTDGDNYIAYCFTSVAGKCKVGSYTGTGEEGNEVDCGFEPAWVMMKRTDDVSNWSILDNQRDPTNPNQVYLHANTSNTENTYETFGINLSSSGFSPNDGDSANNADGGTYIYLAIAKDTPQDQTYQDLEFTEDIVATSVAFENTATTLVEATDTFDGTKFTKSYSKVIKGGRELVWSASADKDLEIQKVTVNLNKEP